MENLLVSGQTNTLENWNIDEIISDPRSTKDQWEDLELFRKMEWEKRRDWFDYQNLLKR